MSETKRFMAAGAAALAALLAGAPTGGTAERPDGERARIGAPESGRCLAPHRVRLEGTGRAPGATGWMDLRFGPSPYGVAVTGDGSYRYEIAVHVESTPPTRGRTLVAWAATPELDEHTRLGPLGDDRTVEAEVSWNKFLVFVTAEADPDVERWEGSVLMTGHSPSGNMHTMAGHGIYQQHGIGC